MFVFVGVQFDISDVNLHYFPFVHTWFHAPDSKAKAYKASLNSRKLADVVVVRGSDKI